MAVKGLSKVLRNLQRQRLSLAQMRRNGITKATLLIERDSNLNAPVEYGNLVGSSYTDVDGTDRGRVGYTADYAFYVHELVDQKLRGEPRPSGLGTYWNPGGPKFLERSVKDNERRVFRIIKGEHRL